MATTSQMAGSPAVTSSYVNSKHTHFVDLSSTIAASISLVLCSFTIGSALWLWTHKTARPHLDRISFRLSLWAMAAQIIQDIIYITLYAPSGLVNPHDSSCGVGVMFRLAMVGIVNYLFTCVAINLLLTIIFGLNPVELRLERFYVATSIFLGIFIPTAPACLGHFGWDPIFETCYFTQSDKGTRVWHFILDLYLWQILSCLIASVCVIAVLVKLFLSSRATSHLLTFDITSSSTEQSSTASKSGSQCLLKRIFSGRRSRSRARWNGNGSGDSGMPPTVVMYQLQDKLKGIALRISLYPIALILVNATITVGDLHTAVNQGIHSRGAYHLVVIHRLLCGGRGIIFAGLCLIVDPCLWRGFKAVFAKGSPEGSTGSSSGCTSQSSYGTDKEKIMKTPELASGGPTMAVPPFNGLADSVDPLSPSRVPAFNLVLPSRKFSDGVASDKDSKRNDSEGSLDFFQALSGTPAQPRSRFASTISTVDFITSGPLAGRTTELSNLSPRRDSTTAQKFAILVGETAEERRQSAEPPRPVSERDRGPSEGSVGLRSMLAYPPSRRDSITPMEFDSAYSLQPPQAPTDFTFPAKSPFAQPAPPPVLETSLSVAQTPWGAFTPDASSTHAGPSSYFDMSRSLLNNGRRGSLPKMFMEALEHVEPPPRPIPSARVDLERGARVEGRRNTKQHREYRRTLEKLYEEAESQL